MARQIDNINDTNDPDLPVFHSFASPVHVPTTFTLGPHPADYPLVS